MHPGGAIFFIPDGRSVPYSFRKPLPVVVKIVNGEEGSGLPPVDTEVQVFQAELMDDGGVILGYQHEGSDGICMLSDVEVVDGSAQT